MKKTGDDEDTKIKANPAENKDKTNFSFSIDSSKYQSFIDEIVI
jgi:hypothetical protein